MGLVIRAIAWRSSGARLSLHWEDYRELFRQESSQSENISHPDGTKFLAVTRDEFIQTRIYFED